MAGKQRPFIVDTRRSMLILNSRHMPVNLGKTGYEDQPEVTLPTAPYYARNVLPTALGYKSAFAPIPMVSFDDEPDNQGIKFTQIQEMFVYQCANGDRLTVALTSSGLWGWIADYPGVDANPNNQLGTWRLLAGLEYQPDLYRLWTFCVVANVVYVYCQGEPHVYMIGTLSDMNNQVGKGAVKLYEDETAFFAVVSQVPSFINMEGQLGVYKAANRLGFWDSDNAVAWSSAIDKLDFTPDATTFAGITTFADVVGQIVTIKSHGNGFVIYSTGSITLCQELPGSAEKFGGSPIMNTTGVAYPTQVAASGPDTTHYAWTTAGLLKLNSGRPEWLEPEVSEYLATDWKLVTLRVINDTHLVMSVANTFEEAPATFYARIISDGTGAVGAFNVRSEEFIFTWQDWVNTLINGALTDTQNQFPDFENTDQNPMPGFAEDRAIVPCFSGSGFAPIARYPGLETLGWTSRTSVDLGFLNSWKFPAITYDFYDATVATALSGDTADYNYEFGIDFPGTAGTAFEDAAGGEFIAEIEKTFINLQAVVAAFAPVLENNTLLGPDAYVNISKVGPNVAEALGDNTICYAGESPEIPQGAGSVEDDDTITWYPALDKSIPNVLSGVEAVMEDNNCVLRIYGTVQDYTMRFGAKVVSEPEIPCVTGGGAAGYKVDTSTPGGILTIATRKIVPDSQQQVLLFEARITGWGYVNNLGNFIKTQRRRASNACIPGDTRQFAILEPLTDELDFNSELVSPLWESGFPDVTRRPLDNPDNQVSSILEYYEGGINYPASYPVYATFQRGIKVPYYPTYLRALIMNMVLNKWGTYDIPHQLIFDATPENRGEKMVTTSNQPELISEFPAGVLPNYRNLDVIVADNLIGDEFQKLTNLPCYLSASPHFSMIRYGKIGMTRMGSTKLIGMSIHAGDLEGPENIEPVNVTVNASYNNVNDVYGFESIYLPLTANLVSRQSFTFNGVQEIPFISVGRWFTVDIKGGFDLTNLVLYGMPEGNMRFVPPPFGC